HHFSLLTVSSATPAASPLTPFPYTTLFRSAILCTFSIFFSFLRIFPNLNALNVIWVYRIHIKTFIHNFPIYYYKRRKRGVLGPYNKDTFVFTWLFQF